MKDGGFGGLPLDELINARDHGVTPTSVKALAGGVGYDRRHADSDRAAVRSGDHGVTAGYVKEMKALGSAARSPISSSRAITASRPTTCAGSPTSATRT